MPANVKAQNVQPSSANVRIIAGHYTNIKRFTDINHNDWCLF